MYKLLRVLWTLLPLLNLRMSQPFIIVDINKIDAMKAALDGLKTSLAGYQVSRYEHSLQSATRAHRDGRDRGSSGRRSQRKLGRRNLRRIYRRLPG